MFNTPPSYRGSPPSLRAAAGSRETSDPLGIREDFSYLAPYGIWNSGGVLLVHPDAPLPPRCIHTNVPCTDSDRRTLTLHSVAALRFRQMAVLSKGVGVIGALGAFAPPIHLWKIALGLGVIGFAFVLAKVIGASNPPELKIAYSQSRRSRLRHLMLPAAGMIFFLSSLGCFGLSFKFLMTQWPLFILIMSGLGLLCIGVPLLWVSVFGTLRIERAAPPYVVITGCGGEFVNSFPDIQELSDMLPADLAEDDAFGSDEEFD